MDFGFEDREEAGTAQFGAVFWADYHRPCRLAVEAEGGRHFDGVLFVVEDWLTSSLSSD